MITSPIGVFDSGYGGLTVLKELVKALPAYDFLYLGDNARTPYGTRSFEVVYEYTLQCVKYLFSQNCPIVIIACNTASAKALRNIQQLDLPKIAPDLRVGNGVKPQFISHDPAVVAAYKADPLVHDRISARLARFIAEAGPQTLMMAPQWTVPTLLLYAGDDRLLNPLGSRKFAAAAPKQVVTSQCFDNLYHEIFNEQDATPVFATLKKWLDQRF